MLRCEIVTSLNRILASREDVDHFRCHAKGNRSIPMWIEQGSFCHLESKGLRILPFESNGERFE